MRPIATLLSILYFVQIGLTQSAIPDFAKSVDKVQGKVKLDFPLEGRKYKNGTGYSANMTVMGKVPKKVGLVSIYAFDPGFTRTIKTTRTNTGYYYTTKTTTIKVKKKSTGAACGNIAVGLYASTYDALKEEYKKLGIDLLYPEEFLDSDEKKKTYSDFKVEHNKLSDWLGKIGGGNHDAIYGYPEGYIVCDVDAEPFGNYSRSGLVSVYKPQIADAQLHVMSKDGKMSNSLGQFAKKLGLDAVVVIYATVYVPKNDRILLQNLNMSMFGPNPVKLEEGKKKKFNYYEGQWYCGTRITIGEPIMKKSKKIENSDEVSFEGFDIIARAMTRRMGEYFDKKLK